LLNAFFSWVLLGGLISQLRRSMLDQPNARSSHCHPTPHGGGFAFVLVSSFSASLIDYHLHLLCLPLAFVGVLDDRHNLPASLRFVVQFATATVLVFISPLQVIALGFLPCLLILISATAVINFTNFMDGLDGLLAGCMVVLFTVVALSGMTAIWPLVGALLGFLLWNWTPAKVFMGDVGSTFLGSVFACVVLQQSSFQAALGLLLLATPLLADAFSCVLRRLFARQRVFQAHRLHLFQRLHQVGWSHSAVSSAYIGATAVLGIGLLAGSLLWELVLTGSVLLIGMWLDQRVAFPFAMAAAFTPRYSAQR
jgi:UDP-N-acetylmuramyl pentapeptide phosphotransferase/UDP-N-acetylglucosamine-1-phosphate transferase